MKLRLSPDLALPVDLVTESIAVLAIKRAGKSYLARKITEQLHHAGQQVVIVDPKGDTWGIRSAANGKDPGLPIVILGGGHGDVPLEPSGGELVAKLVVEQRVSVLLDLADLRKYQVATFMTGFLETLYRLKAREEYRTPMMLVIDEADAIAPQRPMKGEERMLGAAEDIVRRGGQRGIGITMVTQRAAVLNKNVLSQCGILVFLRTLGLQDIDGVNEWINKHGQPEQKARLMADISSLPRGHAWFWAPGWPDERGIFKRIVVDAIETFDSGATPKSGEKRIAPKTVADVDLEAFRKDMAATIEKAKAEDPRALRAEVARLKGELAKKPTSPPVKETRVEAPVVKPADFARASALLARAEKLTETLGSIQAALSTEAARLASAMVTAQTPAPLARVVHPTVRATASRVITTRLAEGLTRPQQEILDTVAMLNTRGILPERDTVARWLGIHPNGGSYGTNLGYLRSSGYLESFILTTKGQAAARAQDTGLDAALNALDGEPKRNIIRALLEAGHPLSREELAERLGLHPNGGSYGTNLGWLRTMGVITERGPIAVTEGLKR